MFDFFRRLLGGDVPASDSIPENDTETDIIRACRERFGSPPRTLDRQESEDFRLVLDAELEALLREDKDPLMQIIRDQDALRKGGQIVWGHLVQANRILFDPENTLTVPANVVYSMDPYFDGQVALLSRIARGLFSQKGSIPSRREMREFVRVITDERERIMRRELPRGYCGGKSVQFTSNFIQPGHLPGNCLYNSFFPLLVNFKETEAVMILPSQYWPKGFVRQWLREA